MKIISKSYFKKPTEGHDFIENWYQQLQKLNGNGYEKITIPSLLGTTIVWSVNKNDTFKKALVIFPGFRTCCGFWDFDNALSELKNNYRIYMVETNGQPTLSEGNTPNIKTDEYGIWASDVLDKLNLKSATIAGASFGGLICLKLSIVAPEKVERVFLLNPGCLTSFSLSIKNLYYNMLPILFPTKKNVEKFLNNAVFYKSHHILKGETKKLIVDYELFVLQNYIDKAQKPYAFSKTELSRVNSDVYLLLGEKDILFPYLQSKSTAEKYIKNLKAVYLFPDTGHGIETSKEAISIIGDILKVS